MREKTTKCLHFSYLNLSDLEVTFKVTGKTVVKLFHGGYSYKCLDSIIPAYKTLHFSAVFMQHLRENQ